MTKRRRPLLLVVCDWNGTLINDLLLSYGAVRAIFEHYHLPSPTLETYRKEITADYMKFYTDHGIPKTALREDMNAIRKAYFEKRWNDVELYNGAEELLLLLRQLRLFTGIVSAEIENVLIARIKQFGIDPFFDHVIGNAWDKEEKLRKILDELTISFDEAAYVDDTYDGLTAAKNVGMLSIGVTHGYNTTDRIHAAQPDPRYVGDSLADVMHIIQKEVGRNR
ncbi:MAG: HAD hydrolase-like protein [Patescibacteria group bacterium]